MSPTCGDHGIHSQNYSHQTTQIYIYIYLTTVQQSGVGTGGGIYKYNPVHWIVCLWNVFYRLGRISNMVLMANGKAVMGIGWYAYITMFLCHLSVLEEHPQTFGGNSPSKPLLGQVHICIWGSVAQHAVLFCLWWKPNRPIIVNGVCQTQLVSNIFSYDRTRKMVITTQMWTLPDITAYSNQIFRKIWLLRPSEKTGFSSLYCTVTISDSVVAWDTLPNNQRWLSGGTGLATSLSQISQDFRSRLL